jgi:hypothetical protein
MAAQTIGAEPVGTLFTGMISTHKHQQLQQKTVTKERAMAVKPLAASSGQCASRGKFN